MLTRRTRIVLCGLAAFAVLAATTGCGPGESVESRPKVAADAGRKILAPADAKSDETPETTPSEQPAPAPETPDAAPVAAQKPNGEDEKSPVTLTSAEQPPVAPPRISTPAEDPSKYPGGIIPASPNAQPLPGGPRLLVPERTFRPEGRPQALRVNYDDLDLLKVLNMGDPLPADVVEQFPSWLRELDGKTIRLRGFMYPSYEEEQKAFVLTRDTGACCFGPNPKVYYLVGVKMKEGTKARYVENRPIDVVGTFRIDPRYIDGNWYQLYRITDATVPD